MFADRYREGYTNVGLAHGVAGVIAVLARIVECPDAPPRARELRDAAVRWILQCRTTDPAISRFPTVVGAGSSIDHPARTGWCYGNPGIAIALWRATSGELRTEIEEMALRSLQQSPERAKTLDPLLCHGAAGLAHMANRFYHATRDPSFLVAARSWFAHTITLYREAPRYVPGLLEGIAGIGLALLASVVAEEPRWDRLLLCDLPVRST